ncbi:hypothetical protein TNIN_215611 [Trichonephila inaurata madagascariensis]|uniref:Uncharacterized protein n=1 Tax=Trichonephila inaurata madagascariensis TaxID=2747483 RepID=A0A8X6JA64_9ARAC|nr:hypothetical protein TNIN_215611 [Trichonephila inaurata madagascariensis]
MASSSDQNTEMDYQNIPPSSGRNTLNHHGIFALGLKLKRLISTFHAHCPRIRKHDYLSNTQSPDERSNFFWGNYQAKNLLRESSEKKHGVWLFPLRKPPGSPIHKTPTASPVKASKTKGRKVPSPPPSKTSKK